MIFKKSSFVSVYKLFYHGFGSYKRKLSLLIFIGFFGSLLDGVGITAIIPLFSLVNKTPSTFDSAILRIIKIFFANLNLNFSLRYLLIFICALFILRGGILFLGNYIKIKITFDYEQRTRTHLFSLLLKASWPFLLKQKLGHAETVLMTNVRFCSLLLDHLSLIATTIASLVVYVFIAFNISYTITALTLLLGILIFYFFKPLFRNTKIIAHDVEDINKDIAHFINESVVGLKSIKASLVGEAVVSKAKSLFKNLNEMGVKINLLRSTGNSIMLPLGVIFVSAIFAFAYKMDANFNLGAMAAVVYLINRIFIYYQQLQSSLHVLSEGTPYLQSLLDLEAEMQKNIEIDNGTKKFIFKESLDFKGVNFSYDDANEILSGVNFNIKRGETVGIIGPSGAGKTTVVDLILRLFKSSQGKINLDGVDINEIDMSDWRKNIGYVSQDIFLLNDTIANNIRFFNDKITDQEIAEATKVAGIYDFIQDCPKKFDTIIGERGIFLSAGQRQRIVLARIMVQKTKFLIFDEATSALDSESEMQVQKVIDNLKGKITILIVAHRLSTVVNCDRLIVLSGGKIIEQGVPRELLQNKETYFYKVYNLKKEKVD